MTLTELQRWLEAHPDVSEVSIRTMRDGTFFVEINRWDGQEVEAISASGCNARSLEANLRDAIDGAEKFYAGRT